MNTHHSPVDQPASLPPANAPKLPGVNRRQFLAAGALIPVFSILPGGVFGAATASPNSKLNIAGIGVGGMGGANLENLRSENIVALCDVDPNYAAGTIKKFPNAKVWTDYREMLEKQKDIDAVVIGTPDHTHAVIAMAAMRAHKHVYCQKPLTHDLFEARKLAEAAREFKVATQMGNQGHSGSGLRSACEWIWDGAIGEVREVEAWCDLSYYPWGHTWWSSKLSGRPTNTPAVPANLNWDLWLGPAPQRPYHPTYHPQAWRAWWDFGSGMMGDRGAHTLDVAYWALKLGPPSSVEATSCGLNPDTHPVSAIVSYRFPTREGLPPVRLTWYEGTRPPRPDELGDDWAWPPEGGLIFKGSKGLLMCGVYGDRPRLLPSELHRDYKRPAPSLPRVERDSHELDWVHACKTGQLAGSHFGYSGPLTEMCLLGNLAKRMDERIEWDDANLKVTNLADANKFVRPACRAGWSL